MTTVSAQAPVRLEVASGGHVPLQARLFYDPADPYAVQARFLDGPALLARWHFDRQMLADGLRRRVGEGDVVFAPQQDGYGRVAAVRIQLRGHTDGDGRPAALLMDADVLGGFLEETYAVTPVGSETPDLDRFLADVLAH
ncbi:SsgA family sporulation/cell division regulator [Streptomyces sp. NPDC012888]|uniref:SsgA family sporulation/cell division regulator n=1 Tax=Streptomyces sp. NPDC012888 TaxID=3364855 RepID=UPI0036B7578C